MKLCFILLALFFPLFGEGLRRNRVRIGGTLYSCTKPNEEFRCGSACQNECARLHQRCPIVNFHCNNGCYCIKGYARNAYGRCIPESDCNYSYRAGASSITWRRANETYNIFKWNSLE